VSAAPGTGFAGESPWRNVASPLGQNGDSGVPRRRRWRPVRASKRFPCHLMAAYQAMRERRHRAVHQILALLTPEKLRCNCPESTVQLTFMVVRLEPSLTEGVCPGRISQL